jgi:hypothetical protein
LDTETLRPDNEHDTRIRKRVESLVRNNKHGRIILECLKTESNEIVEAMLLGIHESIRDSLPLENKERPNLSKMKPRDQNCKLYHLVAEIHSKYC